MFCSNCGNQIKDNERFCGKCGTSAEVSRAVIQGNAAQQTPTEQQATQQAGQAHTQQEPAIRQAEHADAVSATDSHMQDTQGGALAASTSLQENPSTAQGKPQAKAKKSLARKIIIAAVCVVGVVVIAAGSFLIIKSTQASFFSLTFVNPVAFPDDELRGFVTRYVDTNDDGMLTTEEKEKIVQIDLSDPSARSFKTPSEVVSLDDLDSAAIISGLDDYERGSATGIGDVELDVLSLEGIEHFPNLQYLNCTNAGLESLDLSANPELQFVYATGNDFTELDLSNNSNLISLYCDDTVVVNGLSEGGLFARDLMTSASHVDEAERGNTYSGDRFFTYDAYGRLLSVDYPYELEYQPEPLVYSYGARWSVSEATMQSFFSGLIVNFEYDDAGQTVYSVVNPSDESMASFRKDFTFEYDSNGHLAKSVNESSGASTTHSIHYDGENITSISLDSVTGPSYSTHYDSTSDYSYDNNGRVVSWTANSLDRYYTNDAYTEYNYDSNGICVSLVSGTSTSGSYSSNSSSSESTSYSELGHPVQTQYSSDMVSQTMDYTCNNSGSITYVSFDIEWHDIDYGLKTRELEMSYVKRIAPLSERAYEVFLPRFEFSTLGGMNDSLFSMAQQAGGNYCGFITSNIQFGTFTERHIPMSSLVTPFMREDMMSGKPVSALDNFPFVSLKSLEGSSNETESTSPEDEPAAEVENEEVTPAVEAGCTFESPFYVIRVPNSWYEDVEFDYSDSDGTDGNQGRSGFSTKVTRLSTGESFYVVLRTETNMDLSNQVLVGSVEDPEGAAAGGTWNIYVVAGSEGADGNASYEESEEYAAYVKAL